MSHKKEIFTKIVELRSIAISSTLGSERKFNAEIEISNSLKDILVSVENYPELKANDSIIKLMQECTDTEDNIAAARRFYNTALTQLKNTVEIFSGCFFSTFAEKVRFYNYFKATEEEKQSKKWIKE